QRAPRRPRAARHGRGSTRTLAPEAGRLRVPVLSFAARIDGRRERVAATGTRRHAGCAGARPRCAGVGGLARTRRALPIPVVGRRTATRRDRARLRARPTHPVRRRAHRQPRPRQSRRDRRLVVRAQPRTPHHAGGGDARSGHGRTLRAGGRPGRWPPPGARCMSGPRHALRTLRREWRLPELRTLIAALLLSVIALGAVGTLAARVQRAVVMSAAELIGGDLGIDAASPLPAAFVHHAQTLGLHMSTLAEFPSVAFAGDRSQLLSVTAGDGAWPLRGKLTVVGRDDQSEVTHAPPAGSVYLDHRALVSLQLKVGDRVQVGGMDLAIAGELDQQPGGGDLIALAPRAVMALADAKSAGLLGTGSRARHRLLVAGSVAGVDAYRAWAKAHLPADARMVTPEEVQQRLAVAFDRAGSFLRLAALLAALLAGIAVALSAQRYARRKTDEIALLRA